MEVMEATAGRLPWVSEDGSQVRLEWDVSGMGRERDLLIPTPCGVEVVRMELDAPASMAGRNAHAGGVG
jgi:hypothetical protein